MQHFPWRQSGNTYTVDFSGGRVSVIEQLPTDTMRSVGSRAVLIPTIETTDNSLIASFDSGFDTLDEIEGWIAALLGDWDQEQQGAIAGMLHTLTLCQQLLPQDIHPVYRIRLEYLKQWYQSHSFNYGDDRDVATTQASEKQILDWQEHEQTFTALTRHGIAQITEKRDMKGKGFVIGSTSRYHVLLTHQTGVTYGETPTFLDFVPAEEWLHQTLIELDDPRIDEAHLPAITHTIQIVQHILPNDIDILHSIRLGYLEQRISDYLL